MWAKLIKKFYFTNKVRKKVAEFNVFYDCWQNLSNISNLPTCRFFSYPKDPS